MCSVGSHVLRACRLAAELGAVGAAGPGSLRVGLLDNLYQLSQAASSTSSEEARGKLLDGLKVSQHTE